MDNLDMDCIRAMADGYGHHYGAWKAIHPRTEEENEAMADAGKFKKHRQRRQGDHEPEPRKEHIYEKVCPICNREYKTRLSQQKYCSPDCIDLGNRKRNREWYQKKHKVELEIECAYCGQRYQRPDGRGKYCCDECRRLAHNQRVAEQHQKKMEARHAG